MTKNWMRELSAHYEMMRQLHEDKDLLILFDIDGTIVDGRQMILAVLRGYDRAHGTRWFRRLRLHQIVYREHQLDRLLEELRLPAAQIEAVIAWYEKHHASARALLEAHRPYHGVLEVIRWFQIQPRTCVGINSGRTERLRDETLRILNTLGREYRVQFAPNLLMMNRGSESREMPQIKREGVRRFQERGYKVFAYVDDEPENLRAVADLDPHGDILLLHAAAILAFRRAPARAVPGDTYDLTELIDEAALPQHIQFVWRGVNHPANLRQFLGSNIHWAELNVRHDPTAKLVLHGDPVDDELPDRDAEVLELDQVLAQLRDHEVGVVMELQDGNKILVPALEAIARHGFEDKSLWFAAQLPGLGELGFRELRRRHPRSIVQCGVDFLVPLLLAAPEQAKGVLDMLTGWGIDRFSIAWSTPGCRQVLDHMDAWRFDATIEAGSNLEDFLQAALLLPQAITSDFNFPKWHYYGLGSGGPLQGRRYVEDGESLPRI